MTGEPNQLNLRLRVADHQRVVVCLLKAGQTPRWGEWDKRGTCGDTSMLAPGTVLRHCAECLREVYRAPDAFAFDVHSGHATRERAAADDILLCLGCALAHQHRPD